MHPAMTMTMNVQDAAPTPWPGQLTAIPVPPPAGAPPLPAPTRAERHAAHTRVHAAAEPANPYERLADTMRLRAFRRDAVDASISTQTPAATATASTATAPAVKFAPPAVNPAALPTQATESPRTPPPATPPEIKAPTTVDQQSGARAR
jgi:hypothetical protein